MSKFSHLQRNIKYESLEDRFKRYHFYFTMQQEQLSRMYHSCLNEIRRGLEMHKESPNKWLPEKCSMMFLDTCVKMVFYGVDFGGTNLRAIRVELDGNGRTTTSQSRCNIRDDAAARHLPKGLLDKNATASMLFDSIARQIKKIMEENGDMERVDPVPIGFTFSFAIDQKRLDSAILTGWSKGFETGTATKDGVIGRDVCCLLDVALERQNVPARVVAALNDTTGTMLSAAYERPRSLPPCMMGVILGTGLNACYYQPAAGEYNYAGNIINTECGGFDRDLPWNIIDIEVDFASTNRGRQRLEKMLSGMFLPELCRRVVLKVFQSEAPKEAWTHETMPGECCGAIIADDSEDLAVVKEILEEMWQWTPPQEHVERVKALFVAVFDRSAALASVMIAALAKKTGRLQPAMGGLTVGVDGSLYTQNILYRQMLCKHLNSVLGEDTASLIHFAIADDGSGKGAAILGSAITAGTENGHRHH
ncbi:hexokinase-like [Condylostylus longicornis]|uniref:hexokinase-like n=1 Tax=Condylostylus longicornis TaxID=2530218 RepID=UPI00244DD5A0|nr:hexokinase-like [Condylostylus longicornis]